MRNGLRTTPSGGVIGRQPGVLPVLLASILAFFSTATATSVSSAPILPEHPVPTLLVNVRALQEQIQGLQQELTELVSVQPVPENPVEPVAPTPAPALPQLDEQLAELQRQRLRADYQAALQARAQEQKEREQAVAATAQAQSLASQLTNLQAQLEQTRQELEQLRDQEGPRARELEKAIEEVHRQTLATQEQLRALGRERERERQEAADRQRAPLNSYVRGLGRSQEELRQSVEALRQQLQQMSQERRKEAGQWQEIHQSLRALQDRMQNMEQRARATGEESARNAEQQRMEQLRSELAQQQENLRREIQSMNEQLKGATERAGVGTAALRQEIDRWRTDLQRMGQTVGRVERERMNAQIALRDDVQRLRDQVGDLRGDLMQMQGVLSTMLAQSGRSTVGSAGYMWGW